MSNLRFVFLNLSKKIWPKITAYALLGVLSTLAGAALKRYIPEELSQMVGVDTVRNILTILASSMLTVTTFSLSTTVSAYGAATSNVTPRATTLITEDKTTQNALSTFLGTFVFSLVGLIALNMGIYEGGGRFILFVCTIGIVILIIITFIRWIERLTTLGRVNETNGLIEKAAAKAITLRAHKPTFGCNLLTTIPSELSGKNMLTAEEGGYVQYFNVQKLSALADENGVDIYVLATPGNYIDPGAALAVLSKTVSEENLTALRGCFTLAEQRAFEHDPRFGLCVLAEVASRAMPANDHGTALDIVVRLGRILALYIAEKQPDEVEFKRLWVRELCIDDLFQDAFNLIARDAAGAFEVQARLQKTLVSLGSLGESYRTSAIKYSQRALQYSEKNLFLEEEKDELRRIAGELRL